MYCTRSLRRTMWVAVRPIPKDPKKKMAQNRKTKRDSRIPQERDNLVKVQPASEKVSARKNKKQNKKRLPTLCFVPIQFPDVINICQASEGGMRPQSVIRYVNAPLIEVGKPRLGLIDDVIFEREVCGRYRGERRRLDDALKERWE